MKTRTAAAAQLAVLIVGLCATTLPGAAQSTSRGTGLAIEVDATELPRKLISSVVTIPITTHGEVPLWYPKWVPGIHSPGGPLQNVAGLVIEDDRGNPLPWRRDPVEPYRILAEVPRGVSAIVVRMRYIANQPSVNSDGVDATGSELLGHFSINTVLLYRDGQAAAETMTDLTVRLPAGWSVATSLTPQYEEEADAAVVIRYAPATLEEVVDSPFFCGLYSKSLDLVEESVTERTPPHRMHLFSESEEALDIDETLLARFRRLVTEATLLFDSHPFPRYDLLLGLSDVVGHTGLEHLRSSLNVISVDALEDEDSLIGWERYLVPHEYVHAWCGKYRRPRAMLTGNFHTAKDTRLLWIYEGLTQYLGRVLEARSGFAPAEDFAWYFRQTIRTARHTQGREWRSLEDTAAASPLLRARSASWSYLRRSQDYYREGSLFWLEVDTRIRKLTDEAKSLDDFCRVFFAFDAAGPVPRPFTRAEIVETLQSVAAYDWDTLVRERLEQPTERPQLDWLQELGWLVQFDHEEPRPPDGMKRAGASRVDLLDSIGASLSETGAVLEVLLDSPAHGAGLGPGMTVAGIDGFVWSTTRMQDAIKRSATRGSMELLLVNGDSYVTRTVEYDGGPRHLVFERDPERTDLLAAIATPLAEAPLPGRDAE